jgi:hypothetical protein
MTIANKLKGNIEMELRNDDRFGSRRKAYVIVSNGEP